MIWHDDCLEMVSQPPAGLVWFGMVTVERWSHSLLLVWYGFVWFGMVTVWRWSHSLLLVWYGLVW